MEKLTRSTSIHFLRESPKRPFLWLAKAHSVWNHIHCISFKFSIAGTPVNENILIVTAQFNFIIIVVDFDAILINCLMLLQGLYELTFTSKLLTHIFRVSNLVCSEHIFSALTIDISICCVKGLCFVQTLDRFFDITNMLKGKIHYIQMN